MFYLVYRLGCLTASFASCEYPISSMFFSSFCNPKASSQICTNYGLLYCRMFVRMLLSMFCRLAGEGTREFCNKWMRRSPRYFRHSIEMVLSRGRFSFSSNGCSSLLTVGEMGLSVSNRSCFNIYSGSYIPAYIIYEKHASLYDL